MPKKMWTLRTHRVPGVFVFVLIGLFAVMSLTLSLIGLRVYHSVTDTADANSDSQMLLSYLGNKVHAHDTAGGVTVAQQDGLSTLRFLETLEGETYVTTVYAYQGAVWERLAPVSEAFEPDNGERLIAAETLQFAQLSPSLIEATVVLTGGEARTMRMALRTAAAKGVR